VITYPIVAFKSFHCSRAFGTKIQPKSIKENGDDITKLTQTHVGQGKSLNKGITNMLALPIDTMLYYIYGLCPHSKTPKQSVPI
jgi:hypothetical protein